MDGFSYDLTLVTLFIYLHIVESYVFTVYTFLGEENYQALIEVEASS